MTSPERRNGTSEHHEAEPAPFRKLGLGYGFDPQDMSGTSLGVSFSLDHLKRRGDDVVGELSITSSRPGASGLVHLAKHNLTSMTSNRDLAKHLSEIVPGVEWRPLLLELCASVLHAERRGEPFQRVGKLPGKSRQSYLVEPLLAEHKPNAVYGPGGSGKGTLAVYLAVLVQSGLAESCGLYGKQANVLYLDWEDDALTLNARVRAVAAGLGIEPPEIHYRACRSDLRSQAHQVSAYVAEHRIGFVVVDSVEMACGAGDAAETYQARAIGLFDAIRMMGEVTSLLIDHVSEEGARHEKPGTVKPYGSIFKFNELRWAWEMRKEQAAGSAVMHVGLYHAKYNNAAYHAPLGFGIEFDDAGDCVRLRREDVRESPTLADRLPVQERMRGLLASVGSLTVKEIAGNLGVTEDTVRKATLRYRNRLFVQLPDQRWGLGETPQDRSASLRTERLIRIGPDGREETDYVPF